MITQQIAALIGYEVILSTGYVLSITLLGEPASGVFVAIFVILCLRRDLNGSAKGRISL